MKNERWVHEFPAAITVCDREGILIAMNAKAIATFASDGGEALIGTNLLDCHPEPARTKVLEMLKSGEPNVYTIQKGGIRKLIYQSPWFAEGSYAGFVEFSLPLPENMPHFDRDAKTGS